MIKLLLLWQKIEWFTPVYEVHVCEALGLLSALERVHQVHLGLIDFEFDVKEIVDFFICTSRCYRIWDDYP